MKRRKKRKYQPVTTKDILAQGQGLLAKFSVPFSPDRAGPLTTPILVKSAQRAIVSTYDRGELLDFDLAGGAFIAGHAPRNVMLAVKKTAERRLFSAPIIQSEIHVARLISNQIPSCESLYFFGDQIQAMEQSLKAVARLKQKTMVLIVEGCSSLEPFIEECFQPDARKKRCWQGQGRWAGITCLRLGLNDLRNIRVIFEEFHEQIAAVFVEPVGTHAGIRLLPPDVLELLRQLTTANDTALIFDEIHTAFHTRHFSIQNEIGISPDLTCFGSLIGGGFPLGALGGSRAFMRECAVYFSPSTPSAIVMKASLAFLKMLNEDFYIGLSKKGEMVESRLKEMFGVHALSYDVARYGPLLSLFQKGNGTIEKACLPAQDYFLMREHLLRSNILFPHRQTEPFTVSVVHSKKQINCLIDNLLLFFKRLDKNDKDKG